MVGSRVYGISVFLGPVPGKILEPCPLLRGNPLEKALLLFRSMKFGLLGTVGRSVWVFESLLPLGPNSKALI